MSFSSRPIPTYLLPSLPFWRGSSRKFSTDSQTSTSDASLSSVDHTPYLASHASSLRCIRCGVDLCLSSQIISKGFTGRHGRAYLVSPDPPPPMFGGPVPGMGEHVPPPPAGLPSTQNVLPNTHAHKAVPRQLVTGQHTVSDVSCAFCGAVLGWRYVEAEEEAQKYKVGKYILEMKRVCAMSFWESDGLELEQGGNGMQGREGENASGRTAGPFLRENAEIEFDSQDEDECEDLFAGVWSQGLAKRRRGKRNLGGRS